MARSVRPVLLLLALIACWPATAQQASSGSSAPSAPSHDADRPMPPMTISCTCSEPVRSGATMLFAGVLVTMLTLSASAAFTGAAVYLFKKSRAIP